MTPIPPSAEEVRERTFPFPRRHFLSVMDLDAPQVGALLDLSDGFVALNRQQSKKLDLLKGRTLMNLFFENSTRTQSSFEIAGKRLGADVMNMSVRTSSVSKGETLIDTATTLNAMRPDILILRHQASGAAELLARKVDCCVVNAGDGSHEHPTQALLDLADKAAEGNRQIIKKRDVLRGRTLINLFFEASTRTQSSFELAGKRLGADVMNMNVSTSSVQKGETLIDTAMTLNAMRPDILVVRHHAAGAVELLAQKVDCSVINAGDGAHQHPTQALLDALTIRRAKGRIAGLTVAICGDIVHSRVARSNINVLNTMGARVRIVAPSTLIPAQADRLGAEVFTDMNAGLDGVDIVMMLRLQRERMQGSYVPSTREYFHFFGLDHEKLARAKPDALIMHPGPMNRGVEIASTIADHSRSVIRDQVEMGVAVRMAVLEAMARLLPNH